MHDALIHLSGGQDSTYCLWRYLKDNPQHKVVVNHVKLRQNGEDRLEVELQAANNVVKYLRGQGYKITYYVTAFDYGSLPWITIKDIQVVSVFTAIILRTRKFGLNPGRLIVPWHKGEVANGALSRGKRIRRMLEALDAKIPVMKYPLKDMSRRDMFNDMPRELFDMCWVCRKPDNGKPCRKCNTCKEFIKEGLSIPEGQDDVTYEGINELLIQSDEDVQDDFDGCDRE